MKTSELIGPALDWAIGHAMGWTRSMNTGHSFLKGRTCTLAPIGFWDEYGADQFLPSTDWSQGGPIIEREKIKLLHESSEIYRGNAWWATSDTDYTDPITVYYGHTPLIAAMRCYCCAKLGDEIEIPQELQPCQQPNL